MMLELGEVMCTSDALVCPDGSVVGRTGPDCEFAPCSGEEPFAASDIPGPGYMVELPGGIKLSTTMLLVGAGIIGLLIFGGKS